MPTKTIRVIDVHSGDRLQGYRVVLGFYGGGMTDAQWTNGNGEAWLEVGYGRTATVYVDGDGQGDIGGYDAGLYVVRV